jgi:hypothetical protein
LVHRLTAVVVVSIFLFDQHPSLLLLLLLLLLLVAVVIRGGCCNGSRGERPHVTQPMRVITHGRMWSSNHCVAVAIWHPVQLLCITAPTIAFPTCSMGDGRQISIHVAAGTTVKEQQP